MGNQGDGSAAGARDADVAAGALRNGNGTTAAAPPGVDTHTGNCGARDGDATGMAIVAEAGKVVALDEDDTAWDAVDAAVAAVIDGNAGVVTEDTDTSVAAAVLRTRDP